MNNKAKKKDGVNMIKKRLSKFGEVIDGDLAITEKDYGKGHDGSTVGLALHDLFSEYTDLYPMSTRTADSCYEAMNDFADGQWVNQFYSDRGGELITAARRLGWNHAKAHQGRPCTNPVAERQIQRVCRGVRKILSAAGLPNRYWPYASRYWCLMDNIDDQSGDSKYNRRFGEGQFKAVNTDFIDIPFGSRVLYKPQPSYDKYYRSKFAPEGRVGVFLG